MDNTLIPPSTTLYVAVVGADGQEGADRLTMDMDVEDQEALQNAIKAAKEHNRKLVLVCNSSGPITLTEYVQDCNAILCPYFAGQAGGKVVTDAIFGLYNPSGKLTDTWPKAYCDTPSYKNYGGENKEVWYGEGIYVGYRWYDARKIEPLFPFGYGLSYTSFAFSDLQVEDTDVETGIVLLWIWNVLHIVYDSSKRDETGKRRAGIYYGGNKFRKLCRKRNDTALFVLLWYRVGKTGKRIKRIPKSISAARRKN